MYTAPQAHGIEVEPGEGEAAVQDKGERDLTSTVSANGTTVLTAAPSPSFVLDTLWRFACERHRVFMKRFAGSPAPWTEDPILAAYRFTNVFRAADRVSQYLIQHVIYAANGLQGRDDLLFRVLLFKLFNKIETWELLEEELGEVSAESFSFASFDRVLSRARQAGRRLYSAAYIMPSTAVLGESIKHRGHLRLLEMLLQDRVADQIADASSMARVYELLRALPTLGPFLAFQFTIDINYSSLTNFSEMDFVVPGPGARDGIRKCFVDTGGLNDTELIRWVTDQQDVLCQCVGSVPPTLFGRRLQLIDVQNLFCEVSKYARVAHPEIGGTTNRTKIKQRFKRAAGPIRLFFPPKWGLDTPAQCSTEHRSQARLFTMA